MHNNKHNMQNNTDKSIFCIFCILQYVGICGRDGRATASVQGDGGSIPTGGALEVWPCDFGPKQFG